MKKPFIDLHKKYPKKEIALQTIAKVHYIPFETDSDCLLSGWLPECISKEYIIFIRNDPGSIWFFNHQGKHVHTSGRSGFL